MWPDHYIASGICLPGTRISPRDGMISTPDLPHKFPEGRDFQCGVWRWSDAKGWMRFAFPPYGPRFVNDDQPP
jgi:hypothetical protein